MRKRKRADEGRDVDSDSRTGLKKRRRTKHECP